VYPIVDVKLLEGRPVGAAVTALAEGGARLLQLRAKGVPDRTMLALALEAVAAARRWGALVLVNDRPDVAAIAGAAGVHLGQDDLGPADARRILGPGALIGLSTHSLDQVRGAPVDQLSYLAFGPVFPTRTKERPEPVVGLTLLREARRWSSLPLVAIGGVGLETARSVVEAGADGVAAASGLLRSGDPAASMRRLALALS
jgi:thiamine-phosphate pyrophosphorylase